MKIPANSSKSAQLKNLRRLAWFLDNSIKIPGTRYRIGFDGIIGLVPGLGDLVAALLSIYILLQATRMEVPRPVMARMVLNIAIESGIGAIPIIGDIFDFAFKANQRNVDLIRQHGTAGEALQDFDTILRKAVQTARDSRRKKTAN